MALRSSISPSSSTKTQIQTAIMSPGISSRLLPHFLHHIVAVTSTFHSSPSLQHLPFRHHRLVPDWSIDCRLMQVGQSTPPAHPTAGFQLARHPHWPTVVAFALRIAPLESHALDHSITFHNPRCHSKWAGHWAFELQDSGDTPKGPMFAFFPRLAPLARPHLLMSLSHPSTMTKYGVACSRLLSHDTFMTNPLKQLVCMSQDPITKGHRSTAPSNEQRSRYYVRHLVDGLGFHLSLVDAPRPAVDVVVPT
ncbi:predicted protein [Verticillium alfalfae VaMs.102]|uniref:Predicted protein n=1 Tax=Verticillium alfalfae (strain VaMs.102 / ATCC MYA-4576 / FGSC 10136) TaxID=526221 RepID=C9SX92_VERA1|nr:predicted protein [Verticillium alfalfae VaMs.102]EEY23282.1 predicted protein [Verticillium alfalfae VaMs.102]